MVQSYIYAALIVFIITLILVRKNFTKFWAEIDFGFWKGLLKEAWPFALGVVFNLIYIRIGTIILSLIKTDYQVGLYNAAYALLFGFQAINLIHLAMFPRLSNYFSKGEFNKYRKIVRIITKKSFCFLIPLAFLISLLSKQIMNLFMERLKKYLNYS